MFETLSLVYILLTMIISGGGYGVHMEEAAAQCIQTLDTAAKMGLEAENDNGRLLLPLHIQYK